MVATELKIILVVCSGNIHRSVIAERCINRALEESGMDKEFIAVSRGLQGTMGTTPPTGKNLKDYPVEWSISNPILREFGIDISDARSTSVNSSIVEKALLILAMDRGVLIDKPNSLVKQFSEQGYKMRLFMELAGSTEDVPDTYCSDDRELHRRVIELIHSVSTERLGALLNYAKLFQKSDKTGKEQNMIDAKHFAKEHKARNIPLAFGEAYSLGDYAVYACRNLDDRQATSQTIALLFGLHDQAIYAWQRNGSGTQHNLPENSAEQIAGICAAIFNEDIAKSEFGFLQPNVPFAMDNCGMGGDLTVTANISTIAAFIASAVGIPMCKHGSPANADKGECGSTDFIRFCGINAEAHKTDVEQCVESLSFGYTEALDRRYKLIHIQTHKIAMMPHMNDVIGPITNPLLPKLMTRRVMGVNHLIPPRILAEAYRILNEKGFTNLQHGLFVRGFTNSRTEGGMDELSICEAGTQVAELNDGEIKEYWLMPKDFGISPMPVEFVSPPAGMKKGDFSMSILRREAPTPCLQMAIANAAMLFWLAEKSACLKECYLAAQDVLMSGKAYERMLAVRKMLPAE